MRKLIARFCPISKPPSGGSASVEIIGDSPVILHFGETPTLHYYWKTRYPDAVYVDTTVPDGAMPPLDGASSVVVVRHAAPELLRDLTAKRGLPPLILFLDDDIPGILRDPYLPLGYALRTIRRYRRIRPLLERGGASLLVSNARLAARYGLSGASVLPPLPVLPAYQDSAGSRRGDGLTVFFHGTASHSREIRWLREVAEKLSRRIPGFAFEIFGNDKTRRLYRDIPGVRVLCPLPWEEYLAHTLKGELDIGLAPLLDSPFNAVRSPVKYFDITRAGAVGVYSDGDVFRPSVDRGRRGVLAGSCVDAWVDIVSDLAKDPAARAAMYGEASAHVDALSREGGILS